MLTYRLATAADAEQLAELRWEFHAEDYPDTPPGGRAAFVRSCAERLRPGLASGLWVVWVAARGETIVAHIFAQPIAKVPRPGRLDKAMAYLTNVYARPAERNQGVGAELMRHVVAWARAQGFEQLIVSPSDRSRPFYARVGFRQADEWWQIVLDE